MRFDVFTLFPDAFAWYLTQVHIRAAQDLGHEFVLTNYRDHTPLAHLQVDDTPYGGGAGMVLRIHVVFAALEAAFGAPIGVIVADSFGRPFRLGIVNVAIGLAGVPAVLDLRGTPDATGRILHATVVAVADELAAASGLVMSKDAGTPAVLVRGGFAVDAAHPAGGLLRPEKEDLFR